MKLTFSQLVPLVKGAVIKTENADGTALLRRMTDDQRNVYPEGNGYRVVGTYSANISLDFYTDSETLSLTISGVCPGNRPCGVTDLLVDGNFYSSLSLWMEPVECPPKGRRSYGPLRFDFRLPKGEKRITVLTHYAFSLDSLSLELSDGACFRPYTHKKTMIAFGDSITQGFTCENPSHTYISRLGRRLDAEVHNYAIGGERFLADRITGEYPPCDFVTIAYGTNNFGQGSGSKAEFEKNMPVFLEKAHKTFPKVPIFVLLPTWRGDEDVPHNDVGTLRNVSNRIAEEAAKYPNMTIIDCHDAIDPNPRHFFDGYLHPNNKGNGQYAEFLYEALKDRV